MYEPGAGKSETAIKVTSEINEYNTFMGDTHRLNDELELNYDLSDHYFVNLFGKGFDKISPELQKKLDYPPCLCNFWEDPDYYLKKLNYLPEYWCRAPEGLREMEKLYKIAPSPEYNKWKSRILKGHCPYILECKHKEMIQDALNSIKIHSDVNITWLMVKAYLETNMIDAFLSANKPIGIFDENIFGLCFEQIDLNEKSIRSFWELADRLVKNNPSLKEVWTPFKEILKLISNYLTFDRDENLDKKAKAITEAISNFLESFEISVIIRWNYNFKAIALKNVKEIRGTFNIMDYFIKMLHENKQNIEKFKEYLTMDNDTKVISLFISKVELIRKIVQRFYKLIFTDALLPKIVTELAKTLEIDDDEYKILNNTDLKSKFRGVNVYKLNSERGSYSKNTLLNYVRTNLSQAFFDLIEKTKHIIQYQAEQDRNIGLIGSMKLFQSNLYTTNIQKELAPIIKEYGADVSYNHYGNAAGLNAYSNVYWIILFGGYNIPERVRKILSKIVNISMEKVTWLKGPGTLKNYSHRGRPLNRSDVVSLYSLTNDVKGIFEQEKEFYGILELEYKDLVDEIKRHRGVTTSYVEHYLGLSNWSAMRILYRLEGQGLIKKRRMQTGLPGRPNWIWYIPDD